MLKKYIFHYNGSEVNTHEVQKAYYETCIPKDEECPLTEHELLTRADGMRCTADLDDVNEDGYVEVYFEDGNELTAHPEELEEVREDKMRTFLRFIMRHKWLDSTIGKTEWFKRTVYNEAQKIIGNR